VPRDGAQIVCFLLNWRRRSGKHRGWMGDFPRSSLAVWKHDARLMAAPKINNEETFR
jgi:hypothetical protein